MCGFAGFLSASDKMPENPDGIATRMALAIKHRGPDDAGTWCDRREGICLAHRRLSIIDLSAAGHQPMCSATGRFVIAYNGEVYNHQQIRTELAAANAAPAWRGHSDTETLLAAFEHWGVESTLNHAVGMFAFALWDTQSRTLYLARDRFGEKPLYYGWVGGSFVFGSELKALKAYPGFANAISREALAAYMRFVYVPAPQSIYESIFKLEPGCILSICRVIPPSPGKPLRPPAKHGGLTLRRWWSLSDSVEAGANSPIADETEALQLLQQRLRDSVRMQSLADVPLGAFLSGGVDSSAIVALMQEQSMYPVKTFTVGFEECGFDESAFARAVALHLGTEHTEIILTSAEAQAVIPELHVMYDEPFADSSQIPTHLICRAARQKLTVALSGDGGDELFGGYNRHFWGPRIWNYLAWMPYWVRQVLSSAVRGLPLAGWDALGQVANAVSGGHAPVRLGDKAHKVATSINRVGNLEDLYRNLVAEWQDPAQVVKGAGSRTMDSAGLLYDPLPRRGVDSPPLLMMYRDSMTYLPDDILCKVDRAAMAISLETRVPFLDHRVAEVAWRIPLDMKIRRGQGKWALRQILYRYVPRELIERPKAGFAIPLGQWLRGPLRAWAEALLDETVLETGGYFHSRPIRQKWAEHLRGHCDHTASLWAVLMFQDWLASS